MKLNLPVWVQLHSILESSPTRPIGSCSGRSLDIWAFVKESYSLQQLRRRKGEIFV